MSKSKVLSLRLNDQMYQYILEIQKMRTDIAKMGNGISLNESITEIIKISIIRMYNTTFDYWLEECEKYANQNHILLSNNMDIN